MERHANMAFCSGMNRRNVTLDSFEIVRELHATVRSQVYLAEDTFNEGAYRDGINEQHFVVIKTPSINFEDDLALKRIINVPKRGKGKTTIKKINLSLEINIIFCEIS